MTFSPSVQPLSNRDGVLQLGVDGAVVKGAADADGNCLVTIADTQEADFQWGGSMIADGRGLNSQ
jgi:hypothetical protein